MTSFATVRGGIYDLLVLHTVASGALEDVKVLRGMPTNYGDLYDNSRGNQDLIWIGQTSGSSERFAFPSAGMCIREQFDVTVMIQVDRAADTGTQATVEDRAEELARHVAGIIADDPHVGLVLATEGLDSLLVRPARFDFEVAALDSGGREPGHVSALALTLSATVTRTYMAPALP